MSVLTDLCLPRFSNPCMSDRFMCVDYALFLFTVFILFKDDTHAIINLSELRSSISVFHLPYLYQHK